MTLRESSSSPSPMGDRYRSTLFFATADTYGRDMYLVWAALRKDHARIPVTIVKMAKGKRNSLKKKKQQKGTDEVQNGKEDDDDKTCPHISKSVKLNCLQNKVPHTSLGQCLNCGQLDGSERFGVCICLFCAHQGCDRNSEDKHALSHNKENPLHNIVVSLQTWVVWCYACDDEVLVEPDSSVQKCIKLLLKAMNLTPPAELEASLSSQDKVSTEKPKKDGSKANNQLKSQIKGLANLGNTCFFNSVMQNLCQTELLYVAASCATQEGFSYHVNPNKKDLPKLKLKVEEAPGEVTKALWKLLQDFRTSTDRTLTPRQLFAEICKKATRFKGYRQQDSQELLRYLLDSVRNEELRRVKLAVLHSFGVKGDGDAKTLDDSKRVQVREYGASAAAPLIDSVFAGRLVSIVTCHQCHQEFKVEETFLDLSLPLASPPQESFSNKFFGKGGKQNPKSSNTPKNVSKNEKEDEKQKETKSLSKHQLKSAKKAERKKKKGGKGHGKKGKASQQVDDNKQDDDDELDRRASEEEGHELDQMNVSDLEGSDNDHEIKVNETEVLGNSNSGCEMIPDNDIQLRDNDSSSKSAEVSEKDVDTCILDSNDDEYLAENTVDCADSEQAEGVKDSEEQRAMQTEQSTEHLNGGTSRNGSTNDNEENKSSSMEILNCNQVTASKQPSCDSLRCSQEKGTEKVDHYQQGYEEIPSSIKEFLKEIINLAVDLNKGKPSELQDDIVNPSGSFSPSCVSSGEKQGKETAHDLQEKLDGDEVDRKSTKIVLSLGVEHDCAQTEQETNITENQRLCSNSGKGDENEGATEISAKSEEESETESEEEFENDNGIDRILTVQPAYRPSPGECSVLSCLSQFCVSELLDGNNKFACEVCTKRAQRNNKEEGSRKTKDNDKDDVSGDSSSEDEPKGAKAQKSSKNKNKDSQQQTVYTVASKQMLISLAPPVLTLHLKRFQQARFTLQKLTKHVDFPLELNLAPFCSRSGRSRADSEGKVLYSLYGVIQHSGNMNSGHYTAYVKVSEPPMKSLYDKITSMSELTDFIEKMWTQKSEAQHGSSRTHHEPAPSGQWFHVSDSSVSAAAESKVLKSQAYMLFYGRLPLVSG